MTLDQRLTRAVHHVADTVSVPEVDPSRGPQDCAREPATDGGSALAAVAGVASRRDRGPGRESGLSHGLRAQGPSSSRRPPRAGSGHGRRWTPQRIRAEGSPCGPPRVPKGPSASGLDAHLYCVASSCAFLDSEANRRWALEVTQGDRSALFDVSGIPWGRDFDDDSILVQDGTDQAVRFRLLQADGTTVPLRMVSDPVPAVPGPGVMLIDPLDVYREARWGPATVARPYLVDDRAGTIRPLDVPEEINSWGPNVDEFLLGRERLPGSCGNSRTAASTTTTSTAVAGAHRPARRLRGGPSTSGHNRVAWCSSSTAPTGSHWSCMRAWTAGPPGSESRSNTAT